MKGLGRRAAAVMRDWRTGRRRHGSDAAVAAVVKRDEAVNVARGSIRVTRVLDAIGMF